MARSSRMALAAALGCGLAAGGVLLAAAKFAAAGRLDLRTFNGFVDLSHHFHPVTEPLSRVSDPLPFTLIGTALVITALVRRRPRLAATVVGVLVGANVTTQILKSSQSFPRAGLVDFAGTFWSRTDSWPSGHTTAVMSLVLCAVLVTSSRWRPLVSCLGGLLAVAVVYSIIAEGWHLPSDIVGGFLVAAAWTFLGVAALLQWDARFSPGSGRIAALRYKQAVKPALFTVAIPACISLILVLAHFEKALRYADNHTTFVAGAWLIGLMGLSLAAGLAAFLRARC